MPMTFGNSLKKHGFPTKEKEKAREKARKEKEKIKEMANKMQTMQINNSHAPWPAPSRSSQASGSHQGFFAHCVTTAAEVHDSEVNLLSGMMTSCQDEADCKVNNGEMIFDGMSAPVRYSLSKEMLTRCS